MWVILTSLGPNSSQNNRHLRYKDMEHWLFKGRVYVQFAHIAQMKRT